MQITLKNKYSNDKLRIDLVQYLLNIFTKKKKDCISSDSYGIHTSSMKEYWLQLGKKEALVELLQARSKGIRAFSYVELIHKAVVNEFGQGTVLVLFDIDLQQIGRFKDRFPSIDPIAFTQDVLALPCQSVASAIKITARIPEGFASIMIVDRGVAIPNYLDTQ